MMMILKIKILINKNQWFIESHTMDSELQSEAELQFDVKIRLQKRNVELPDRDVHSESKIELQE